MEGKRKTVGLMMVLVLTVLAGSAGCSLFESDHKNESKRQSDVATYEQLFKAKVAQGHDVSEPARLNRQAMQAAANGDYDQAKQYLTQAINALNSLPSSEHRPAEGRPAIASLTPDRLAFGNTPQEKIRRFRQLLEEKRRLGVDVSRAEAYNDQAKRAAKEGNFEHADRYLTLAMTSLDPQAGGVMYAADSNYFLISPPPRSKETPDSTATGTDDPTTLPKPSMTFTPPAQSGGSAVFENQNNGRPAGTTAFRPAQNSTIPIGTNTIPRAAAKDMVPQAAPQQGMTKSPLSNVTVNDNAASMVKLPVKAPEVTVISAVPEADAGKDVTQFGSAFAVKSLSAADGFVELKATTNPVYIVAIGDNPGAVSSTESPFGMHPANTTKILPSKGQRVPPSREGHKYEEALDLGVGWDRPAFYVLWGKVQNQGMLSKGTFDFKENDYVYQSVPQELNIFANIGGLRGRTTGSMGNIQGFRLADAGLESKFADFVQESVKRYDGSNAQVRLNNPIRHWQVLNEPDFRSNDWQGYTRLYDIASKAVKDACPSCKVAPGGLSRFQQPEVFDNFYKPMLEQLRGRNVDIFDIHVLSKASIWQDAARDCFARVKRTLQSAGYSNTEIWVTETGTYSGSPKQFKGNGTWPFQSEKLQASDLVKRFSLLLGLGAKKVFWAFGMLEGFEHDGTWFDNFGLIYDGRFDNDLGRDVKKLSFYSYKKLIDLLEGCDFSKTTERKDASGATVITFVHPEKTIYVVWAQ
ncbi:hypothetical protein [Desulfovibrio inopinatus]|uniref:hypothetical protein n=1 Tax=Desulfovibrio inopinatus TaxID=102109 RepID=UPI0003FD2822|nr:hypothetical protein [Desulfovibrio inopinatus]